MIFVPDLTPSSFEEVDFGSEGKRGVCQDAKLLGCRTDFVACQNELYGPGAVTPVVNFKPHVV